MDTRKIYYEDSHCFQFTAEILRCQEEVDRRRVAADNASRTQPENPQPLGPSTGTADENDTGNGRRVAADNASRTQAANPHPLGPSTGTADENDTGNGRWAVILDATAFYPEGGGQAADTGILGGRRVLDTREQEGQVIHFCDGPLTPGQRVEGRIDRQPRFLRMQQHSGEHIVSGLLHKRYGCHNVGFHMGSDCVTIDFDCVIPPQTLPELEEQANEAVWANLPLRCYYPSPEELAALSYRTKRALLWPVRIVEIPGIDRCACCGTHVSATGEIGLIKLLSAVPFRGGTRMEMACGQQALALLNTAYAQNKLVSQAFSVQIQETGPAAQRMNQQLAQQKYRMVGLQRRIFSALAREYAGTPDPVVFEPELDGQGLRELADLLAGVCPGTVALFSGSDQEGYSFCLAARDGDARPLCREMTGALRGRGGGKPGFQQGRVDASRAEIADFFRQR